MIRIATVVFVCFFGTCVAAQDKDKDVSEVSLTTMIEAVQGALLDAQKALKEDSMLPLSKVGLVLNTVNKSQVNGRTGFWVFKADASYTSAVTSRVEMTLTPPAPDADDARSPASQIREVLGSAIFEGAAARSVAINGTPPLNANRFVITLEFAIISDGKGGVTLAVPPFEVAAGASISQNQLQKIVLSFE